ncbi:hypothetical protein IM40_07650 [Candidatus Paracaedimonas acanthamoebae]|nr:hypothetical protein IM40_07650 [Candidatus Paracaedimonas acanthamoebae]
MKTNSLIEGAGLFISSKAESQILALPIEEIKEKRLRVCINSGGCAGFQYTLHFDNTCLEEDIIFASPQQVEIIMDKMTYEIIQGSTIDYVEELIGAAFVIKNPNAKSSCGCGNSFSVI